MDAVQFAVRVRGALRVSSTSGSGVDDLKAAMLRMLEQHDLQRQQPGVAGLADDGAASATAPHNLP